MIYFENSWAQTEGFNTHVMRYIMCVALSNFLEKDFFLRPGSHRTLRPITPSTSRIRKSLRFPSTAGAAGSSISSRFRTAAPWRLRETFRTRSNLTAQGFLIGIAIRFSRGIFTTCRGSWSGTTIRRRSISERITNSSREEARNCPSADCENPKRRLRPPSRPASASSSQSNPTVVRNREARISPG